jgi:hypothetical protein
MTLIGSEFKGLQEQTGVIVPESIGVKIFESFHVSLVGSEKWIKLSRAHPLVGERLTDCPVARDDFISDVGQSAMLLIGRCGFACSARFVIVGFPPDVTGCDNLWMPRAATRAARKTNTLKERRQTFNSTS